MTADRILKALAEPTRLRIAMLLTHGELCVCDLTATLDLPQSTVSRHMAVLRSAHIVLDRRSKKWVHYRLSTEPLASQLMSSLAPNLLASEPYAADHRRLREHLSQKRLEELSCVTK